ncbi:MAG: cytochrome c [Methylobacter sp.]|nr:cytochrome c [Methylobacter sp.]MDP2097616.1 cytochrome c [Methylobacter sp.]MDP2428518.1 cytochrome c [Methylobacter sp.]MDP3056262.1 cytochrome c [Methylobacter sp.]MDP3363794.1 cytochrome c [Methylobacter sp.]
MKLILVTASLLLGLAAISNANAASIYAGQAKAEAVCSQCHGIKNPSAEAPFPPLAGRDADYLKTALKQYRDKTRQSDIMNAIAGSLSDDDISNVATYYARLKP